MPPLLSHHFLLPTAHMQDERFFDCLIYLCRHSDDGAFGFIINQPSTVMTVGSLLSEMGIDAGARAQQQPAMNGGVVQQNAGFVLHTGLPEFTSSLAISENVCLTTSKDILPRLAPSSHFTHFLLLMGFCRWYKNQLADELDRKMWLVCPASSDIIFDTNPANKLPAAYHKLGILPELLNPDIGTA